MTVQTQGRHTHRPDADAAAPRLDGLASRRGALALLQGGLARRGGFDDALGRAPFTDLSVRERAFARALAATTLRRLGQIDRRLEQRLARPPPPVVRDLLRLGAAQLLFMDTPAHAAVSTTVAEAGSTKGAAPFKGLINAVLRGVAREAADATAEPTEPEFAETNAPPWLYARWRAAYGEAAARAIAARIVVEPQTDLSLRDTADVEMLAVALDAVVLPGGGLRTPRRGDLAEWPGFAEGRWWVQDASAAFAARLLHVRAGEDALDLCAAPGGKTLQLAAAGAKVTALDRSATRMARVRDNLARIGLEAELVVADGADWPDARRFDAVLLDAPCSSTGAFRRHPDVLWAARAGDIAKLAALQTRLLDAAAGRVRPGGRLVYCVCSLEPEEGEAQADAFLARHGDAFVPAPIEPGEGGAPDEALTPGGALRLHPAMTSPEGGLDGFFIARFVRRG